jgi:hypothetical protein
VETFEWQAAFFPDVSAKVFFEKDANDIARLPLPGADSRVDQRFIDRIEDLAEGITARLKEMKVRPPLGPEPIVECVDGRGVCWETAGAQQKIFMKRDAISSSTQLFKGAWLNRRSCTSGVTGAMEPKVALRCSVWWTALRGCLKSRRLS